VNYLELARQALRQAEPASKEAPPPGEQSAVKGTPAYELNEVNEESPPSGHPQADAALAETLALIDRLASMVQAAAKRTVLDCYRAQARRYRAELDELLFETPAAIRLLAARWGIALDGRPA
jgi:hypothetical protein